MGYEIYEKLCNLHGVKTIDVARATGIDSATFSSWKKGTYIPKADKRTLIADYFGVSLEYLDTGKDSKNPKFDPEVLLLINELSERPELKTLLRASENATKEDIEAVVRLLNRDNKI